MTLRHKERKFGRGCVEQWKANREALRAGAAAHWWRFDAMLKHKPYLFGDCPVYADFLLWGIIGNYTWKGWNELPKDLTALPDWRARMDAFVF
jgi:glutathione S-transferase